MNNLNAAHEFINNITEFGKLINNELSVRDHFIEAKHAKLIDSYLRGYATKYTLKLVFDDCTVTINFKLDGQQYKISFIKRIGRKTVEKHENSFCWAFAWDKAKNSVDAYGMLIAYTRELINNL